TDEVAALLTEVCDDVTFSLNTAEAESYAQMMRTPARNFERVVENIRKVVRMRGRGRRPKVRVQFLVWRENYTQIPRMYDLARDVGADAIVFNGLSHLRPDQTMSVDETGEMMRLYEAVVRRDEYRTIETIQSFEQDITPLVREMNDRLTVERSRVHPALRAIRLLGRRDFTLRETIAHHVLQRRRRRSTDPALPTECLIGWYSLVIRSDGLVAPCCIFQATPMGNVFRESVDEIWNGERYQRFRSELRRIMDEREGWQHDPAADTIVGPLCGATGVGCPVRSFYFQADHEFRRGYARATGARG
ncbi:MAG TPA: SPASM domain-containing protein, partial [Thermoanaerobaculia bacterium]